MPDGSLSALLPAAGTGSRLGAGCKAWLTLAGEPVVGLLLTRLGRLADLGLQEVLVAMPASDVSRGEALAAQLRLPIPVRCLQGGPTRQDTVRRLVEAASGDSVLLHDVARPLASEALFRATIAGARGPANRAHAAIAALPLDVPVALVDGERVVSHVEATRAAQFQSPQVFPRAPLARVLAEAEALGRQRQSTAQLWLDAGMGLHMVPGEKTNLKITTPDDWHLAQAMHAMGPA